MRLATPPCFNDALAAVGGLARKEGCISTACVCAVLHVRSIETGRQRCGAVRGRRFASFKAGGPAALSRLDLWHHDETRSAFVWRYLSLRPLPHPRIRDRDSLAEDTYYVAYTVV